MSLGVQGYTLSVSVPPAGGQGRDRLESSRRSAPAGGWAHEPRGPSELFSEDRSAEVVVASFASTPDPRLREIMTALVRHLHDFVKDVELTEDEWERAIEFLTRTGQTCTDVRQEFILLSDVLGRVDAGRDDQPPRPGGATESTVLGPFHMAESPPRDLGADIALDGSGEPCLVSGRVPP